MKQQICALFAAITILFGAACADEPDTPDTTAASDTTTAVTAAAVTTSPPETTAPPITDDGLIDDEYTGVFTVSGDWQWSGALVSPMELYPETLWINGGTDVWAKYEPKITAVGNVRISAYILGWDSSQTKSVEYAVSTADGVKRIFVDTSDYKKGEDAWLTLGTFAFDGSGSEFVQLSRVGSGNTRASTVRFEILNSANEEDVWQYLYLGPCRESEYTAGLAALGRFSDLADCTQAYDIETLAELGIIGGEGSFRPEEAVTAADFAAWLSAASGQTIRASGEMTADAAAALVYDAAMASGKNLEWLGDYTDAADFIVQSGIAKTLPAGNLTRADAAALVKGYYRVITTAGVPAYSFALTFQDEFIGNALDWNTWQSDSSAPGHILSTRWPSNVEVKDGVLRLLTKKEKIKGYETKDWTTGNVWVKSSVFRQKGGWWEASIKINGASGLNNAFWMINGGKEIDIVEAHYRNVVNTNLHVTENGKKTQYSKAYHAKFDLSADFHTYALHWTEKELIYYFDGEEIVRKTNYGADSEMWPYLSTAVLNWAGKITDEADGQAMEVDWVRIYQEK